MMKKSNLIVAAALLGVSASFYPAIASAQTATAPAATVPASTEMTDAEVRKVDKENGKVTLKHGAIKNLDMPPMTMVFQVRDAALLDKVKPGDKVRFKAMSDAGKMTVTDIQPAP